MSKLISLTITNDATLKGATVRADETLNLTVGNNLTLESVRDSSTSSSNGFNMSAGVSTTTNASLGTNTGRTLNKQTVLSSLTGENVNITTGNATHIKGAMIAATDHEGKDTNNLNLTTKTLTFENLANTNYSSSNSMSAGLNGNSSTITSASTSFSTGMNYERTKTLATLGTGNINITDKENSDDTDRLNRDATKVDKALFKTTTGTSVDATLDMRLLSVAGVKKIAEDFLKTGMIADTIEEIATNSTVDMGDFMNEVEKRNATYEAIKQTITTDPELAKQLNSSTLNDAQKESMMNAVASEVMIRLGYAPIETKLIATTETGRDDQQVKGFYSTQTNGAYVNDLYNDNNYQLIQTTGTEAQRAIDAKNGSDFQQDQAYRDDRSTYSQNFGTNVANYTNFTLGQSNQGGLSTQTNQSSVPNYVTMVPSIFNNEIANNNLEFIGLDKEMGDNRQLSKEEKVLNSTKEATLLKEVLADKYPNIGKENVDYIFEKTQKGMVNAMDAYLLKTQINLGSNQANKEDMQFISQEAKDYFIEAAQGNVYLDKNTQTLVPMMDTNHYKDSTYGPSSNGKIITDSIVSYGLTAVGMVPNPWVAIPAWFIDTGRGTLANDYSNSLGTLQNLAPNYVGNPLMLPIVQQAGAAGSIFNTTQNIGNYNDKIKELEKQRDKTNTAKPIEIKPIAKPIVNQKNYLFIPTPKN